VLAITARQSIFRCFCLESAELNEADISVHGGPFTLPAKCFGRQCWLTRHKSHVARSGAHPEPFLYAAILVLPISIKISDVELTRAPRCRRTVSVCTFKARKARTLRLLCTYPNVYRAIAGFSGAEPQESATPCGQALRERRSRRWKRNPARLICRSLYLQRYNRLRLATP
jgi:hypothetical protein